MFTGLNEGAAASPYAMLLGTNKGPKTEAPNSVGESEPDLYSAINPQSTVAPVAPPRINNATMGLIGNAAYRNPNSINRFQENAKTSGILGPYTPGEWDDATEEAYNKAMSLDMLNAAMRM